MKTLFSPEAVTEIENRLNKLSPDSKALWGKMTADQMLAHCTGGFELATGENKAPRLLIGRLIGGLIKPFYTNDKPFKKNSPTDPSLRITDQRNFDKEKQKLQKAVQSFHKGGESICTSHPHPFFGKLTPREWGIGMYKHLDHHLSQFGV